VNSLGLSGDVHADVHHVSAIERVRPEWQVECTGLSVGDASGKPDALRQGFGGADKILGQINACDATGMYLGDGARRPANAQPTSRRCVPDANLPAPPGPVWPAGPPVWNSSAIDRSPGRQPLDILAGGSKGIEDRALQVAPRIVLRDEVLGADIAAHDLCPPHV